MRLYAFLASVLILAIVPAGVSQGVLIDSINGSNLASSYSANTGTLTIDDTANIGVDYTDGTLDTYSYGHWFMDVTLDSDDSSGGIAQGSFNSGNLALTDAGGASLFAGTAVAIYLVEPIDGVGLLSGTGTFEVTGGQLAADFGPNIGQIVQITFSISPATISDFSQDFTGNSSVNLIPEPATLALLGLGGLAIRRRRR